MELSTEERELYDRQIRIWGVEAQSILKSKRILIVNFDALTAELAKNCILGGVSVSIMDIREVSESDLSQIFFLEEEDIGTNKGIAAVKNLRLLNELVKVQSVNDISEEYDAIVMSGDLDLSIQTSKKSNTPLYYCLYSERSCLVLSAVSNLEEMIDSIPSYLEAKRRKPNFEFCSMIAKLYQIYKKIDLLDGNETYSNLRDRSVQIGTVNAPCLAVSAGMIAQDISSKFLNQQPQFQAFLFDSETSIGYIDDLVPFNNSS